MDYSSPLSQTQLFLALSVFAGTFLYEDGATLLAATLAASGRLDARLGMTAAIAGIWVGDLGLYVAGALVSRYGTFSGRISRLLRADALAKANSWFERHGSFAIVMSRVIPGSRLPLYLAAGALQMPVRRFARVTGICSALWVSTIFAIWRFLPATSSGWGKLLPWLVTGTLLMLPLVVATRFKRASQEQALRPDRHHAISSCAL